MSGTGWSGQDRSDASDRSSARRSWALPGRRGAADPVGGDLGDPLLPTVPLPADTALRALPVRPAEPAAEEHHLGDRLSAFLDGELGHDSRERVLAHLATCPQCKAEADEGRSVKHLLTRTDTPGPSSALMARLMAVGSLPEDAPADAGRLRGRDDDDLPGGGVNATGTLGGSRLTGGSFGRGAGASFGAGALGADAPLPGFDPRAFGRGSMLRPLIGRRSGRPEAVARPDRTAARPQPAAAVLRPSAARGRRLVFAAAGAFSVAAVTLGGVGGLTQGEEQHGTTVSPVGGTSGRSGYVPMNAQVPVDFPGRPVAATRDPEPSSSPERYPGNIAALRQQTR
ncbi:MULTISPECIES: anti-sigma factor family protein [unclassified Kitasatospora]|uniref:anti-sigma factor family protein n=1 Tax=unclassified Kitasatospora TaxID=2633591 RepID=UPI0035E066F1